jgi:hypothetical protein
MEIVIASVHYWINMLGIEIFWLVSLDHVYVQDISRMIKALYTLCGEVEHCR